MQSKYGVFFATFAFFAAKTSESIIVVAMDNVGIFQPSARPSSAA